MALARKMLETLWILATRKQRYFDCDQIRFEEKMRRYNIPPYGGAGVA